jgi:hypothetical protein
MNVVQNSTLTARVFSSAIKTVRDTTVASAYHRLKSDDNVIRAIEDLENGIPMVITYHWVEGHQDKTKAVRELPWPSQLNVRALF